MIFFLVLLAGFLFVVVVAAREELDLLKTDWPELLENNRHWPETF
jgi:hypothetical protein